MTGYNCCDFELWAGSAVGILTPQTNKPAQGTVPCSTNNATYNSDVGPSGALSVSKSCKITLTLPKRHTLDSSKLKEIVDDNFKFDENGRKFSKWVENAVGKGEIARYEQFLLFSQCFQKDLLQTRKN